MKPSFGSLCVFVVAVLAIGGLAAGFFGARWIYLDLLAHFRVHFSMALGVCVLALLFRRWRVGVLLAGLVLIPVTVGLQSIVYKFVERPANLAQRSSLPIKVLAFNNLLINKNSRVLEKYLRREQADIIVLNELGASKRSMLRRLRKLYPYQKQCAGIALCHIAVLSKYRFVASKVSPVRSGRMPPYVRLEFGPKLSNLTFIGTHFVRPPFIKHQLGHVNGFSQYVRQIKGPVIVAGDFNLTPWSYLFKKFERQSGLSAVTGRNPTWPVTLVNLPQFAIDHIFTSSDVFAQNIQVGPRLGSDHLPLHGTFFIQP